MYKHILIPTDGSELSARAIRQGIDFAKDTHARVTLLTVSSPFHVFALEPMMVTDTLDTYEAHAETNARARLNSAAVRRTARSRARQAGLTRRVVSGRGCCRVRSSGPGRRVGACA